MKKDNLKNVLVLIQTVLAVTSCALGFGCLFEKSYLILLEIILMLFVFIFAFNNYKYYKIKALTVLSIIFGIILLIEVII